ncbi:ABC transporter substrate-binding protein [Saccharomonospora xinjiangensis]|uniref:ABC-type Fe3+-hydroxamate transport system, periplasmic component n=1 Tax=Saccharomonospora xinjiangensis XJ-54 TaxID=882086 RepID=I0V5T8_9PSEU|nr:iron-siderophore ABC transporter substrate-binding protein [Saccharomonospora xinjiangensis]EID55491.1 ABC-type Fe3+-hydroxamate transport system, periplasmic component [Saccharomonospora xinjiangensis XJ-54]
MIRLSLSRRRSARATALTALTTSLVVFASTALAACSPPAEQPSEGGSGGDGFPRTVSHAMGETAIDTRPETVAALDSSFVDAALALETKVVAYTKYPASDTPPDYLGDDVGFLSDARVVGDLASPDVEALYDIAPDLVVSAKVRHESIYNELSNVAPTVFSETTGATWKDNIRLLAEALGKEDLAERKIADYERRAEAIGKAIEEKEGGMPTYSLVRFVEGEPTVRLYTPESFPGIVASDVGLRRPEGQPSGGSGIAVELSQEQIGQLDADHIWVSSYVDDTQKAENPRSAFESNPLWDTLSGEISEVSDQTWYVSVSLQGAHAMLDDIAERFGVDPARE